MKRYLLKSLNSQPSNSVFSLIVTTGTPSSIKTHYFTLNELEVVYNKDTDEYLGLKLSSVDSHKLVKLNDKGSGVLINVTGRDIVGQYSDPNPQVIKDFISQLTVNGNDYSHPFDLESIYRDLVSSKEVITSEFQDPEDINIEHNWYDILKSITTGQEAPLSNSKPSLVMKAVDEVKQVSLDVIAEHSKLDAHNNWYSKETLQKACENFNKNLATGNVTPNLFHIQEESTKLEILRTFIIPYDCKIGEQEVAEGTWVGEMKYHDKALWAMKISGEILGVSIGGMGYIRPAKEKDNTDD